MSSEKQYLEDVKRILPREGSFNSRSLADMMCTRSNGVRCGRVQNECIGIVLDLNDSRGNGALPGADGN